MPTSVEVTDPLLWTYRTVLPVGVGVCDVCHGAPNEGFARCYSCSQIFSQLQFPLPLVVPISLSRWDGQLHHSLRNYKNSAYGQQSRDLFSLQIAALFERFLFVHKSCIAAAAGEDWDVISVVPSSQGRTGPHPLESALRRSPWLASQLELLLGIGPTPATHNQANVGAYRTLQAVDGRRVLLVDDTYTTGARAQSAASVLRRAGAHPIAVVPAARYVNPDWPPSQALMGRSTSLSYSFDYCAVGSHPPPSPRSAEAT